MRDGPNDIRKSQKPRPPIMYMKIDDMGLSIRKFEVCTSNNNRDGGLGQMLKWEKVFICILEPFSKRILGRIWLKYLENM